MLFHANQKFLQGKSKLGSGRIFYQMLFHANQKFLQGNIRPAVLIHASDGRTNPRPLSISNVI